LLWLAITLWRAAPYEEPRPGGSTEINSVTVPA
jgi:hypothetical protein